MRPDLQSLAPPGIPKMPTSTQAARPAITNEDSAALDDLLVKAWNQQMLKSDRPRVQKVHIDAPYVALTFDDGPNPVGTPQILDTLQKYHAHATFFVVGMMCARYPTVLARMVEDGHEIGNHTYDHFRMPTISLAEDAAELERNRKIIHELTGQNVFLFRPPGGRINPAVEAVADSLGYTTTFWRLDSGELARDMNPDKVYHRVVDHVRNGDIVLLHNGDPNILVALPRIMSTLSHRGFQFVTVSELLQLTGARPVEQIETPEVDIE